MIIELDNGQVNLLVSALGVAASLAPNGPGLDCERGEYLRLRDQIQVQGGGQAGERAQANLALLEAGAAFHQVYAIAYKGLVDA